jgi:hypothetical protein
MNRLLALLPVSFALLGCSDMSTLITTPAPADGTISRDGYKWLHESSGGVDENGNYLNPMHSQDAFGQDLGSGIYRLEPEWSGDGDHLLQFETQNGYVVREGHEFYP